MAVLVDIFGSNVSRDVLRYTEQDKFEISSCIGNVPITNLYERIVKVEKGKLEDAGFSNFEIRMLRTQFRRKAVQYLKESDAKILFIDLSCELMERWIIEKGGKEYQIAVPEGKERKLENLLLSEGYSITKRFQPYEISKEDIEISVRQFAEEILWSEENPDGYKPNNIIVLESMYTPDILGNDGNLRSHDKKYKLHECNEWLRAYYLIFYKYIQDCHVIKLPEFTHSTDNHLRGIHPLNYMGDAYEYFVRAIDVVFGYSNCNSLENLYKEKSLKNKLETRVVNTSMMYGLKAQVSQLKNELEIIKKSNNNQIKGEKNE